jgi:hypothetical protein
MQRDKTSKKNQKDLRALDNGFWWLEDPYR